MKKIIFVLLAVLALALAGCGEEGETQRSQSFIGGTQGLEIRFMPDAPPDRVADQGQQEFDVLLEIRNRGEYEVPMERVLVILSGFRAEAFGLTSAELVTRTGDDVFARIKNPDGSIIEPPESYASFEGLSYQEAAIGAGTQFPFRVDVCYGYETTAASELCIKENMNLDRPGDLCSVDGRRTLSVSGAPVQVSNMEQRRAGADRTIFTFTVQNKAPGSIYRPESDCEAVHRVENRVFVTVQDLPGDDVNCVGLMEGTRNAGYIILDGNNPKTVSCTYTVTDRNNRVEPFNVRLAYDYKQTLTKKVDVEHHPLG